MPFHCISTIASPSFQDIVIDLVVVLVWICKALGLVVISCYTLGDDIDIGSCNLGCHCGILSLVK